MKRILWGSLPHNRLVKSVKILYLRTTVNTTCDGYCAE